nr:FecR domain-containing protein [Allomuricauda sp.]
MNEKEIKHLINKYLEGSCTQQEKELLDKILDSYDDQEEDGIYFDGEKNIKEEIYLGFAEKAGIAPETKKTPKPFYNYAVKIAASLLILVGLGSAVYLESKTQPEQELAQSIITKTTEWGQRSDIVLSDGTRITLNAGSSIEFPESFEGATVRQVILDGEAFFEVAKNPNKPFLITTEGVTTKVLGTSFNVNSYAFNDHISVTVKTGKVQVQSTSKNGHVNTVYLLPNEKAEYSRENDMITKSKLDNDNYLDWKNGIIRFNDITFLEASKMLSRWYGIHIGFENSKLKNCHVTARYENAKLQVVLESIKYATKGMDYEFIDQENILFKGFCKN